ncbi:J domain-containing protein, partial [Soehngenia saccharolytica]
LSSKKRLRKSPKIRFRMSSIRISAFPPNASAIASTGSMDLGASGHKCAANGRFKPSFTVSRASRVSAAEYQSAPAIEAGGHMRNAGTLYEVLGLSRGATSQEIKTAYRKMARQFHPDTAVSSKGKIFTTEMFLQIHSAYAVLSRAEDRAQYDRQLEMQQRRMWNRGAYREPHGHVVRNWETDQCW